MDISIKNLIDNSKTVALFFHVNPDADAIGSALGLKYCLESLGKHVTVFSQDKLNPMLNEILNKNNEICYEVVSSKFDLGVVLDCSEISRIGEMSKVLNNCKNILNIDHHLNNQNFTEYKIVNEKSSSTCELVYNFMNELNVILTSKIALPLYCGLATDSGCFMFNISPNLHTIANELVKCIDDVEDINYHLFREKELTEIKLYGEAFSRLEIYENKLAFVCLTLKDFKNLNAQLDDTIGLIFTLSGLKNIKVICVAAEEKPNCYKIAFRSKMVDVCALAKVFGGGGHKFASGCKIYGAKNKIKQKIIEAVLSSV